MAEQIIKKLKSLDEQAAALLARRTKEERCQNLAYRKSLATPLTFDFEMEFEENITTPKSKAVSEVTEDKSDVIKTLERSISFKTMPEHTENNFEKSNLKPHFVSAHIKKEERKPKELVEGKLKSRPFMSLYYLKYTTEEENAKSLDTVSSHYKQVCQRTLHTRAFSPIAGTLCEVCKKEKRPALFPVSAQPEKAAGETADLDDHSEDPLSKRSIFPPQMIDLSTKEKKSIETDQLCQCPAKEKSPLALCLDDELQKSSCKIILAVSAPSVTSTEQHESNPIIFHETEFIQKFILTKNSHLPQPLGSRNIYLCETASTASGRLGEISESLVHDQPAAPTTKRTRPPACIKDRETETLEVKGWVVDTQGQAASKQALEKVSRKKSHNLSQNFSDFTKKYMGSRYQSLHPETNTRSGKYERMFNTEKLVSSHKSGTSPFKYYSQPIQRSLHIHFVSTITPLDELLNLPSEDQTNAL